MVTFGDGYYRPLFEKTYNEYLADRAEVYGDRKDKFICLMDLALMGMKKLKQDGLLDNMEESDEINACSIVVPVEFEDKTEEWLISFLCGSLPFIVSAIGTVGSAQPVTRIA